MDKLIPHRHKFAIGNPCGPCEWHIASGVLVFAWFDFIFQAVFVVPIVLQFKIHLNQEEPSHQSANDSECDPEKTHLAVAYSISDILNIGLGMLSDIVLYVGGKQNTTNCLSISITCGWIFLIISIFREGLHIAASIFHVMRCSPETFPYEFVTRGLGQYLIYGIWLGAEYLIWLYKGCQFVPRRGLMEPPVEEVIVTEKTTAVTFSVTTSDLGGSPVALSSPTSVGEFARGKHKRQALQIGNSLEFDEAEQEEKKRKKKKRRSKKKSSTPSPDENPV